jgi:hypothetical protein
LKTIKKCVFRHSLSPLENRISDVTGHNFVLPLKGITLYIMLNTILLFKTLMLTVNGTNQECYVYWLYSMVILKFVLRVHKWVVALILQYKIYYKNQWEQQSYFNTNILYSFNYIFFWSHCKISEKSHYHTRIIIFSLSCFCDNFLFIFMFIL